MLPDRLTVEGTVSWIGPAKYGPTNGRHPIDFALKHVYEGVERNSKLRISGLGREIPTIPPLGTRVRVLVDTKLGIAKSITVLEG